MIGNPELCRLKPEGHDHSFFIPACPGVHNPSQGSHDNNIACCSNLGSRVDISKYNNISSVTDTLTGA